MKLDLGSGPTPPDGYVGVDRILSPGVVLCDLVDGKPLAVFDREHRRTQASSSNRGPAQKGPSMNSPKAVSDRTGARAPSRKEASSPSGDPDAGAAEPEPPSTYLFTVVGFEELCQKDGGAVGLTPLDGYHLHDWKPFDEGIVVCWEHDDA